MYSFKEIQSVQLEISTHCNAACPQCPRNFFGGRTLPALPLHRLSLKDIKDIFTVDFLRQLEQIYLCGTYGDPMTNPAIGDICEFFRQNSPGIKIGIHTNGGVGSVSLYQKLAGLVDFIAFGIDGLKDTNHVYRRHVRWNKIMQNAAAFIAHGGYAIWDFIVFAHNQHQVEEARKFSGGLGFKEFNVKKTSRFLNRNHEFRSSMDVYDKKGFVEYKIAMPTVEQYVNDGYHKIMHRSPGDLTQYLSSCEIKCNAVKIKEIYIGADGFVFPCGWLHDRLYGPEVTEHPDYVGIRDMMSKNGSWINANVFYTPLQQIVDGDWFKRLEMSWSTSDRLERCAMMCGSDINVIGPQNSDIGYKS